MIPILEKRRADTMPIRMGGSGETIDAPIVVVAMLSDECWMTLKAIVAQTVNEELDKRAGKAKAKSRR